MLAALALALQAQWKVAKAPPEESVAAANLFIDGCLNGAVRISRANGHRISEKELPDWANAADWGTQPLGHTTVKMEHPPATYLDVVDYDAKKTAGLTKVCVVASRQLNQNDAFRALQAGSGSAKPVQTYHPQLFWPEWTIDAPKQGYRKRMILQEDHSVLLELRLFQTTGARAGH